MKKLSILLIIMPAFLHAHSMNEYVRPVLNLQEGNNSVMIKSNLYALQNDGSTILLDGVMTQYNPDFSNNLDSLDVRKMSNFSENLGMVRGKTTLVIERRKTIAYADTIFFKLWQTRQREYQFEFIASNMQYPGLTGYLEDSYLHTVTPLSLNDSNHVNFSINSNPASADVFRFRIIFTTEAALKILPLTFISANAYQKNNFINVDWKTANESNLKQYDIERSVDGKSFSSVFQSVAYNATVNNYGWIDDNPFAGENYYRIKASKLDGKVEYSKVLKVHSTAGYSFIKEYPNPVEGNAINLLISNQPAAIYKVRLLSQSGQVMMAKSINHPGGSSTQTLQANQIIPKGIYQLEILRPGEIVLKISLVY